MNSNEVKRKIARKIVRLIDDILNFAMLTFLLVLLLYGGYSLWDSNQIYAAADSVQYKVYKPSTEDTVSFDELCKMNPEVLGWLTVYGTSIDYPITQGEDNWKYLNTSAEGEYSLAGAIFVDSHNSGDFSDYNTFIHGHHMEASAMFGDLGKFTDQRFFDEHSYGELYINGDSYGIIFFSFSLVDAYNEDIYYMGVKGKEEQEKYLQTLLDSAMYMRHVGQEQAERLVVLSTCSSDMTNGRYILAGYLTDEVFENQFASEDAETKPVQNNHISEMTRRIPIYIWMLLFLVILIILLILVNVLSKWMNYKRDVGNQSCEKEGKDNDGLSK